jgi:hypothetical protein
MLPQLLLSKRLFLEGRDYSRRGDPVSCGLAISLFQDSVELYLWALIKEQNISVKENSGFTKYLDAIEEKQVTIPFRAKLLDLNKARVNFKHYGILPATEEAIKYLAYTEDFLKDAMEAHFSIDYDTLSIVDLVIYGDVREELKAVERLRIESKLADAASHLAIAKAMLLGRLDKYVPRASKNLADIDRLLNKSLGATGINGFRYITQYLDVMRSFSIASMLQMPLEDFGFLETSLPNVSKTMDGKWHTVFTRMPSLTNEDIQRMLSVVVELSIRISRHFHS